MSRVSGSVEKKSFSEFWEFRAYWRESSEYPKENIANTVVVYPVIVVYSCPDRTRNRTFHTQFRAFVGSGPDDGTIDIDAAGDVVIEDYHLSFKPAFQRYEFERKSGSLIISGSSPKMEGSYKVTITPTIAHP